jgi:threonylcarbamoyladenosine tRNA methylthiotransferase MtaB
MIRRALRKSPDSYVIVTGCYAQLNPQEVKSIEGVDLVLGTNERYGIFQFAGDMQKLSCARVEVSSINEVSAFDAAATSEGTGRTRAFLKVQDGCDYSCSFCTIPRARGRSRSQGIEECVAQAVELVTAGFKEIVLTGVNVGDYRGDGSQRLVDLLGHLVKVDGLERLRISSIEPNLLTEDILDLVDANSVLCHHFHVPLQSGCDEILRMMKRRYGTRMYAERVNMIRNRFPDAGIGADVIVGFPGETDAHFEQTCDFLEMLPLSYLHVFTYSEREDTAAATMPNSVQPDVRSQRNAVLRSMSARKRQNFLESLEDKSLKILLETEIDEGYRFGFSGSYARVGIPAEGTRENTVVDVRVVKVADAYCIGKVEGGA